MATETMPNLSPPDFSNEGQKPIAY
jgi:hypothetical protein